MREHGVLNRVLLIYETVIRKIDGKEDFDPAAIFKFGAGRAAIHRGLPRTQRGTATFSQIPPSRTAG
jgi:hypothetical protein